MQNKKVVCIIPARMGATRFPGKPLAKILDLPMIEHVRRRSMLCEDIDEVYVATCDDEIREVVESFGGHVIVTSKSHVRCTDRIEEAAKGLDADIIINVQGDEPIMLPHLLSELIQPMQENTELKATCFIYPVRDDADLNSVDTVKAVLDQRNFVMYFSRSVIPNFSHGEKDKFLKQSGLMAYDKEFLHLFSSLPRTPLEKSESVDMLRILENGYQVYGVITPNETKQVDLVEHVAMIENEIKNNAEQKQLYERILRL